MNRFLLLTLFTFAAILGYSRAEAGWTVIYDVHTGKPVVIYTPDAPRPCPQNHYNPYQPYPYQPYGPAYRPYNPQPTYQFNFGHDKHKNHNKNHGKNHNKPCK